MNVCVHYVLDSMPTMASYRLRESIVHEISSVINNEQLLQIGKTFLQKSIDPWSSE